MRLLAVIFCAWALLAQVICEEVTVTIPGICISSKQFMVKIQSLHVNSDHFYSRVCVQNNAFDPSVESVLDGSTYDQCLSRAYDLGYNSFSFEDGVCTGYSFWIPIPSPLAIDNKYCTEKLIFLANSELTQYEENQVLIELPDPEITGFEWRSVSEFENAGLEVSVNVSQTFFLAQSLDLFLDDVVFRSWEVVEPNMKIVVDNNLTDASVCKYSSAYLRLSVNGTFGEKYYIKEDDFKQVNATIEPFGFINNQERNTTFWFLVKGEYDLVSDILVELETGQNSETRTYAGGSESYNLYYSPDNGICSLANEYGINYTITLRDKFQCSILSHEAVRDNCGRTTDSGYTDFCSLCALNFDDERSFGDGHEGCYYEPKGIQLLPKVDSSIIFEILENIPAFQEKGTAWVDYTFLVTGGGWMYADSTTEVDEDLLDMTDFNAEPNDVNKTCSIIKREDGKYKLLKEDCKAKHLALCLGSADLLF